MLGGPGGGLHSTPHNCPGDVPEERETLAPWGNHGSGYHLLSTYHVPDSVLSVLHFTCSISFNPYSLVGYFPPNVFVCV